MIARCTKRLLDLLGRPALEAAQLSPDDDDG
jgi:hypothetical protein